MDALQEKKRQLFFTNLLLLGFDVRDMEEKYHIAFNKDMFQLPNKKGFEVVTHFLFMKINVTLSKKEFRIVWPIFNKEQEQEFRKTCFMHLTSISQEDSSIKFPRIVQSLFLSPGGERFYELYLVFSTYTLKKIIEKGGLCQLQSKPSVNIQNSSTVKDILSISTNISVKKFTELQKELLKLQEKWQECAENLIACYRKSKISVQEKQKLCNEAKNKLSVSVCKNMNGGHNFQDMVQESNKQLYEVQKKWKTLEEFLLKEKHYWESMKSEVEPESTEKCHLNGNKYVVQIPEILIKDCKDQLQKKQVWTTEGNGKLCIKNFINLFIICVEYYAKMLREEYLLETKNISASLKESIKAQDLNLGHLQSLSKKLATEVIPDSKKCIDELESVAYARNESLDYQMAVQLPPATPPMVFSPNFKPDCSILPEDGLKLTPATGKTPDELVRRIPVRHIRKPRIYNTMQTPQLGNPWEFQDRSSQNISNVLTSGASMVQSAQKQISNSCFAAEPNTRLEKESDESDGMTAVSPLKCKLNDKYLPLESNEGVENFGQKYWSRIKSTIPRNKIETFKDFKDIMPSTISKTRTDEVLSRTKKHVIGEEKDPSKSFDQVKSKLLNQIVNTVIEGNLSIDSPDFEESSDPFKWKNEAEDFFGNSAFITQEKLRRTPPLKDDARNSNVQIALVKPMFNAEDFQLDGSFNDEDMLEAVTLPPIPYFNICEDIDDPWV